MTLARPFFLPHLCSGFPDADFMVQNTPGVNGKFASRLSMSSPS
jgi:hypothetical protein